MAQKSLSARLDLIEQWWKGNGIEGAQDRLLKLEDNMVTKEFVEEAMTRAAQKAAHSIVSNAKTRDMTMTARIRAWSPIVVALIAAGATIVGLMK